MVPAAPIIISNLEDKDPADDVSNGNDGIALKDLVNTAAAPRQCTVEVWDSEALDNWRVPGFADGIDRVWGDGYGDSTLAAAMRTHSALSNTSFKSNNRFRGEDLMTCCTVAGRVLNDNPNASSMEPAHASMSVHPAVSIKVLEDKNSAVVISREKGPPPVFANVKLTGLLLAKFELLKDSEPCPSETNLDVSAGLYTLNKT
jgi:hypothetical protein